MAARLFCKTGQLAGANFEVGADAMIGKTSDCAIQLYPQLISSRHARIYFDDAAQSYVLEDLGSRNGTKLDGVRVKGKERLGSLHVITFANTFDFLFQVFEPTEPQQQPLRLPEQSAKAEPQKTELGSGYVPQPVRTPEMKTSPGVKKGKSKTVLSDDPIVNIPLSRDRRQKTIVESDPFAVPPLGEGQGKLKESQTGKKIRADVTSAPPSSPTPAPAKVKSFALVLNSTGKSFALKEGPTILGRDESCGIRINDGSVSRKHAEFTLRGDKLMLKDLGSKNHTYVNDQKISGEVEVHEGVLLRFGVVKARLAKTPA